MGRPTLHGRQTMAPKYMPWAASLHTAQGRPSILVLLLAERRCLTETTPLVPVWKEFNGQSLILNLFQICQSKWCVFDMWTDFNIHTTTFRASSRKVGKWALRHWDASVQSISMIRLFFIIQNRIVMKSYDASSNFDCNTEKQVTSMHPNQYIPVDLNYCNPLEAYVNSDVRK